MTRTSRSPWRSRERIARFRGGAILWKELYRVVGYLEGHWRWKVESSLKES